jgi:tRNA A37 N6-isopentenylltransferase MiaA
MKVILLVGAPRCGKTQLALQMCVKKNGSSVIAKVRNYEKC